MNDLHIVTRHTTDPRVFNAYWMTGLEQKGRVKVTVPLLDDGRTAAELTALQHLLSDLNVCGHNKAGAGLRIWSSSEVVGDLMRETASHAYLARYANFLRTRYLGARLEIETQDHDWADAECEKRVDVLEVTAPAVTTIEVNGFGLVELTAHAVARYVERFERPEVRAWRDLVKIAGEVRPARLIGRKALHDVKHRRPGRLAFDAKRNVLLTVAAPDRIGMLPRLVSVMKPDVADRVVEDAAEDAWAFA